MWNDEDRKWLYEQMRNNGVNTGSYDDFSKSLESKEDRDWYYQKSRSLGLNVGSAEDFASMMVKPVQKTAQAPAQPVVKQSTGQVSPYVKTPAKPEPKVDLARPVVDAGGKPVAGGFNMTDRFDKNAPKGAPKALGFLDTMSIGKSKKEAAQKEYLPFERAQENIDDAINGSVNRYDKSTAPLEYTDDTGKKRKLYFDNDGNEADGLMDQMNRDMAIRERWEESTDEGRKHREKRLDRDLDDRIGRVFERNGAADVAERAWQKADERYNLSMDKPVDDYVDGADSDSFWDRIMSGARSQSKGTNLSRSVAVEGERQAAYLSAHDLQKMSDDAWGMLGERRDAIVKDLYESFMTRYPGADEGEVMKAAKAEARRQSDERMYELAIEKNAPANVTEFFLRRVTGQNIMMNLFKAAARSKAGSTGDMEASDVAMERYKEKGHKVADIAGSVVGIAADPFTWASGVVGGAAARGGMALGARLFGQAATRKFGATLAGRLTSGVIGGSANFATFEAGGEAVNQLKWGGKLEVNEETGRYKVGDYDAGAIGGAAGHGLVMGAATGVISPLVGNVSDKLVRATNSTAGKVALRTGELGVGTVAEGTVFAVPEFVETYKSFEEQIGLLSDPKSDYYIADENERGRRIEELKKMRGEAMMDVWNDNMAMMIGFKAHHAVKSAPARLYELFGKDGGNGRRVREGFEGRLRRMMDGHDDLALTKDEKKELESRGYGDLRDLVEEYSRYVEAKEEYDNARQTTTDASRMIEGGEVEAELPYNRFVDLMTDNSVSEAARAKMYYYLTGRTLPMSTVIGSSVIEDTDAEGNVSGYIVQSYGANGVITSRSFESKKRADVEVNRINRQAELNGFDVGERYYDWKGDNKRMYEACEKVAEESGAPANLLFELMKRKTDAMNEIELQWAEKIFEAYEGLGEKYGSSDLRSSINDDFGVDVDKAIGKERNRRSEQEQKAIDEYAKRLFADAKRKQEDAEERGEAPTPPDDTTGESEISALLGLDDGGNVDPVSSAFNRGHDADAQERLDISIELSDDPNNEEAREAWNGVVQRIKEDAAYMVAQQRELTRRMQHTDGCLRPAILKEKDSDGNDQQVYIVDGNVVMTPDGEMVDKAASDNMVVVYDAVTGERRQIDPGSDTGISSLGEVTTAEQVEADIERIWQEYVQAQIDEAQGTVRFAPGQRLVLPTGEEGVVVATDAGGEHITVALGDGSQTTVQRSELQRIRDEKAMADYRMRHGVADEESPETQSQPQAGTEGRVDGAPVEYTQDMELSVRDEDGTEKPAMVMGRVRYDNGVFVPDAEGNIIEYFMDGEVKHVHEDKMRDMVVSHVPVKAQSEVEDNGIKEQLQTDEEKVIREGIAGVGEGLRDAMNEQAEGIRENDINDWLQKPAVAEAMRKYGEGAQTPEEVVQRALEDNPTDETRAALNDILRFDSSKELVHSYISQPKQVEISDAMPMMGSGYDAEPDFMRTTPHRGHKYIYNEAGLSRDEANQFVSNNIEVASKSIEKIKGKFPKMGTSLAKYNKDKAAWQQQVSDAQAMLDYWKSVKNEQDMLVMKEREAQRERDIAAHDAAVAQSQADYEARRKAEAERKEVGNENPMPSITEKWHNANKVDGRGDEIVLPDGTPLKGHYVLHESGASSASHNPVTWAKTDGFPMDANNNSVNDRDYERDHDAQSHTESIARQYDQRALQSVPVVSKDGVVLSGNGRTMAGELAARDYTDGAYVKYLKEYAPKFGFTPEQVAAMEHPRVSFVPDEAMPYTADTFAKFNQQEMKSQNKTEQAVKLGKTVSDDSFNGIVRTINGYDTIGDFYNDAGASLGAVYALYNAGVLPQAQLAEMVDGVRGQEKLSAVGREFLENMLIGKAFEGDPEVVRMLTAEPAMRQTVITALGEIVDNISLGGDWSLNGELADAVKLCFDARQGGARYGDIVSSYARQGVLFADPDELQTVADFNNATMLMLADVLNDKRVTLLKTTIALYNNDARLSAEGVQDMFENGVRSRESILKDVINFINNNYGRNKEIEAARAAAVERRKAESVQKDGSVAESGGGSKEAERSGGVLEYNPLSKKKEVEHTDPRTMSDEEKERRGTMLRNATVIYVEKGILTSTSELSARKAAEKWWDENVAEPVLYDTEVGEVEINRNSVESSLAHRYGQKKLDAITSLVDGFENAVYLGTMPDSRERGVIDHYFAYPIMYDGELNYVFCRAMQDANKNRLYVHEVFVADKIKKGDTLQTAASKPHGGISLYRDILANVLVSKQLDKSKPTVSADKVSDKSVAGKGNGGKVGGEDAGAGGVLFSLDGQDFRKGDRVSIKTKDVKTDEYVVVSGTLSDKEKDGVLVNVIDDEGKALYGYFGDVKLLDKGDGGKVGGEKKTDVDVKKDKQGNPLNEDGSLKVEKIESVDDLTDNDFISPTRNVELPVLPKNVDDAIGAGGRPVVIKKNIFGKNKKSHRDLSPSQSREILAHALYQPNLYGQNQKSTRPYNWILIHNAKKHSSVILEVNHTKDNVEIVNWHYLDDATLRQKERQAVKEGGLILTLNSAAGDATDGLSSADKVSDKSVAGKGNGGKVGGEPEAEAQRVSLPVHKEFAKYRNNEAGTVAMVSGDGERGYVVRYYQNDADAKDGVAIGEVEMTPQEFKAKLDDGKLSAEEDVSASLSQNDDKQGDVVLYKGGDGWIYEAVRDGEGGVRWSRYAGEEDYSAGLADSVEPLSEEDFASRVAAGGLHRVEHAYDEVMDEEKYEQKMMSAVFGAMRGFAEKGVKMEDKRAALKAALDGLDDAGLERVAGGWIYSQPKDGNAEAWMVEALDVLAAELKRRGYEVNVGSKGIKAGDVVWAKVKGVVGSMEDRLFEAREVKGGKVKGVDREKGDEVEATRKNVMGYYRKNGGGVRLEKTGGDEVALTEAEVALRDAVVERLRSAGVDVVTDWEEGQRAIDEANGDVRLQAKKRALETASVTSNEAHQPTVVSSADGAKVLKELDRVSEDFENLSNQTKFFLGAVAKALGAKRNGSKSEYATFETKNGRIVTIRLADHNARVSTFDNRGEPDGISIVVSPKRSEGITNDGEAHVVEYYYDAIKLRRAEGKPLADIVRSIKQALYSGEFKDTTGLAEVQEVNGGVRLQKSAPVFYSNAERAVNGISQKKATAEQWLAMVKKQGGIKAGEDKWLGLSDWLESRKGESLTKDEVLGFIRENRVEIEEVNYSADVDVKDNERMKELQREFDELMVEAEEATGSIYTSELTDRAFERMVDRYGDDFDTAFYPEVENGEGRLVANRDYDGELNEAARYFLGLEEGGEIHPTRLDYTTDGLEHKKEIAFTVPTIAPWNEDDNIHFGDAGGGRAVAWVRFGETTDGEGRRVLVIDEIQSNRHQEGREKGYVSEGDIDAARNALAAREPAIRKRLSEIDARRKAINAMIPDDVVGFTARLEYRRNMPESGEYWRLGEEREALASELGRLEREVENVEKRLVPDAPFEKNWHEMVMKRMLRYAAEMGYDKVAWTKGVQQAERYELGKQVDEIRVWDNSDGMHTVVGIKDGRRVFSRDTQDGESGLAGLIGKDMARKAYSNLHEGGEGYLTGDGYVSLRGKDLSVGGVGMRGFYDEILPRFMDKYGKKWGVKTEDVELPKLYGSARVMHAVDVTDGMKESVMEGQPMFFRTKDGRAYGFVKDGRIYIDTRIATAETPIHEYAHLWGEALRRVNPKEWRNVVGLMKGTGVWSEVVEKYPELKTDDAVAEEVLAHFSGRRGAERLREAQRRVAEGDGDLASRAKAVAALERVKEALRRFWKGVADFLGIHYTSAEEVADRVMKDLLDGVDPRKVAEGRMKEGKMVDFGDGLRFEAGSEEAGIVERAKGDGTFMKAPNGKQSKLSPRQWVQVRTRAFKEWFGDWAKAARVEKLRRSESVTITGKEYGEAYTDRTSAKEWAKSHIKGEYINADTGEKILVSNVGVKEVTSHGTTDAAHMQSIAAIPEMIKHAVFIEERENRKGNGKFDSYRYYVVGLKIGDMDYTAKLVVGVKDGARFYDHRLSKIEKGTLIDSLNGLSNTVAENQSSSISEGKGMTLVGLLQTNSSKVVDENGEPLVVYHGTPTGGFSVFGERDVNSQSYSVPGVSFFSSSKTVADGYSTRSLLTKDDVANHIPGEKDLSVDDSELEVRERVHRVTKKVGRKNVEVEEKDYGTWYKGEFVPNSDAKTAEESKAKAKRQFAMSHYTDESEVYDCYVNLSRPYVVDANGYVWRNVDVPSFDELKEMGYDGVIIRNVSDSAIFQRHEIADDVIAFSPTQIKSATENVGRFDSSNPDIRYQFVGERGAGAMDKADGSSGMTLEEVNERFNDGLSSLTEENKDRVVLSLGRPSGVLLSAGVEDKPMKLYGNKVMKKKKKHGFTLDELNDLPRAVADPIAVFDNKDREGNRSILTDLRTAQGNFLVTVDLGKGVEDIDFNIISSVFGKSDNKIVEWINNGLATYINKEKALNYLHHSAPIAEALSNPRLVSAAKVVEEFENPAIGVQKNEVDGVEDTALYRIREGAAPKKTGVGYKVFVLKDGKLYPPMVANPGGEATPVGVWLDADAAPVAGVSKTGRQQVKAGGKGTQGGSGRLAYRPGWHLGEIPYALQFNRVNPETGVKELFPANFVWAEVEYAADVDYQEEAMGYGVNASGKFQHSLAGLPRVPENGSYRYRTNPDPRTDAWVITGAMKVKRVLTPSEVDAMVEAAGREPQQRQAGGVTDKQVEALNANMKRLMQEDLDMMRRAAKQMGEKLHTDINIIENAESITHPNAAVQERRRKAKGWYDTATGQVNIVLSNNRDLEDVKASVGHETIAHKGLRELVGEEHYDEFLDETYHHLRGDLKKEVDDAAGRSFIDDATKNGKNGKSYEQHRRTATDELFGRMAEKPFEEFSDGERTLWQKLKAMVRRLLDKFLGSLKLPKWFELGDNELRYILWRSKERLERGREHPIDLARDIVKREELGLSDEARYNMGDAPETFNARQRRAVEKRGVVMPGLNDAEVKVVDVPRHDFTGTGKQAIEKARIWANGNLVGTHTAHQVGNEFDYSIDEDAVKKFLSSSSTLNSENLGVHLAVLTKLPNVIDYSIEVEEHPDYRKVDGKRKAENGVNDANLLVHRMYGAVNIDGNIYRVKTTMHEHYGKGNAPHDYRVTKIELLISGSPTSNALSNSTNGRSNVSNVFVSVAKVLHNVEKAYDKGKKLLDESKKSDEGTDLYRDSDETEDIWKDQSMGLQERITAAATRLASNHKDHKALRNDAMRAIGGNLSDLRKAMSLQRQFDMTTVKRVHDLARVLMSNGYLDGLSGQEVKRLLAALKNSVGHNDIDGDVQKVMDIMVDNHLKHGEAALHSLETIKGSKVDARGVEVMCQLDTSGAHTMKVFKKTRGWDKTDIEEAICEAQQRMGSIDVSVSDEAALEYTGLQLALKYVENINDSKVEERKLRDEIKHAHDDASERERSTDTYRQYIASLQEAIRQNKIERAQSYFDLVGRLSDSLRESIANAKDFKEAEKQRIREIQHNANSDMEGRPSDEHYKPTFSDKFVNNSFVSFLFAPLATFDQMLRMFGGKSANGEGYLYNRFMRGWVDARQKEINGVREKYAILDAKAAELFGGKVKTWGDLIRRVGKLPKGTVSFWNGGKMQEHELTQGNLMYIYMVNKMLDGRMKLRKMGITEEHVSDIEEVLDNRLIELADWLQDDFLVQTRNEYNETHKRMFGASMAAIEHYFPLKILANARADKPEDLDNPDMVDGISTATGSIIKRRRNALALDITGADALSVILDHVAQMEHWNAYAEFNRDINTLRTYKRFRNQVQNMHTIYGSGKELWKKFNDVCQMASGTYRPPRAKLDEAAVNFAKGVTAAKVSFRMFTALKQFLSMPAYIPEARTDFLLRNIANPVSAWMWSMEHLPIFSERWRSRMSGDPRLLKSDMDWKMWRTRIMKLSSRAGMSPNAFVDALTVSIGAHSMYQTRLSQYLRDGYSEDDAEKKAVQDAEVLYNQTQQSSEGAFTSTMQVDRSWLSVLFTVFRNASMSYQRQLHDALRNLKHNLTPGGRSRSIEFMKKQYVRDGIDESQAEQNAKRKFRRQMIKDTLRVATFGYIMQFAWNLGAYLPYLLFGDDENEKQKMWDDVFAHTTFGSVEGLTGGDIMSQAGQMVLTGEGNPAYLSKDMPLTSDIMEAFKKLGNGQHAEALNDMINLIVQSGLGVNPQSITDVALSIMDACGDDPALAHEATICISRILQVPQSQIDKMYFDEIGLSGDEVSNYTPAQLAERYAEYKVKRGSFFSPWSWDDEKRISKFTDKANKTIKEHIEQIGDKNVNEAYLRYEEVYNSVDAKVKEAKKTAKTDYVKASQLMSEAHSDPNAFAAYQMFKQMDGNLNKIVKLYLGAKTSDEAALCRKAILEYKSAMVQVLDAKDVSTREEAMESLGNVMQGFYQKYIPMQQLNR